MTRNDFSITDLEHYIAAVVRESGATTTVYNNRPKASVKADDFAVVAVSGKVEDMGCYGKATVGIDFFAKDLKSFKNTYRLEAMCSKFLAFLKARAKFFSGDFSIDFDWSDFFVPRSEYLIDAHATVLGDTADDFGFTARMIEIKTTILIQTNS